MVTQEPSLVEELSIAENVMNQPGKSILELETTRTKIQIIFKISWAEIK